MRANAKAGAQRRRFPRRRINIPSDATTIENSNVRAKANIRGAGRFVLLGQEMIDGVEPCAVVVTVTFAV
jgi:hypothetical protein